MRALLIAVGVLLLAMGLLWVAQGLSWVAWPKESFMLGRPVWSGRGAALAGAGLLLLFLGLRRRV